jgi:peptide/nickel transport system substrate-binding protein
MSKISKKIGFVAMATVSASLVLLSATANPASAAIPSQADAERRETLIVDIDGGKVQSPDLWNPFVPGSTRNHGLHQSSMEPLFILNYMTGKINPWLGASMTPNKAQDVWTLKIQKAATWNDGKPVTSDDVIFTIDMLKANATMSNGADMKQWVKSMKKVDDKTVEFTLTSANPRFQLDYFSVKIWGSVNIVPKHIWEGKDPLTFKNYDAAKAPVPVFSGPYKLKSFNTDGTEFIWERDDNWWGAKSKFKPLPAPKKLIFVVTGLQENKVALMSENKLDSAMDMTLGAFQALKAKNPKAIAWYDKAPFAVLDPCPRNFEFNTTLAPWNDPEMRWAVNYAIDRNQIVQVAYENTTSASRIPYPMYPPIQRLDKLLESKGLFKKYPIWEHSPEKAMAIFEKKGYAKGSDGYYAKDGKQLSLVINTHDAFIEKQRITDVLVEQFQAVGINASHVKQAGNLWGDNLNFGKFESHMGWQSCGSVNEPWATLDTLNKRWIVPVGERANRNGWRWSNDKFSAAVDQMATLPLGDRKVDDLFVVAMEEYLKELPNIPITQAKKLIPFDSTYWTNWPTDKNKYAPSWTWWQSTFDILVAIKPAK